MFGTLARNTSWKENEETPYCLLNNEFEGLHARIEKLAPDFAAVYSQEDDVSNGRTRMDPNQALTSAQRILRSVRQHGYVGDGLDFVGLHMLAKHEIYRLDAMEDVGATLNSVKENYERSTKG